MRRLLLPAEDVGDEGRSSTGVAAEEGDRLWTISVHDNGIGFDPKKKAHAFAPFGRLEPRRSPGSGIGLAICRRIVERHGGTLDVDTRPGEGSRFFFTLPGKDS